MELQDDRSEVQKHYPYVIVVMTDRFMSGWGKAQGGPSYAGWACHEGDISRVEGEVRTRSDAMRVRLVQADYRPPPGPGHCHIYVWKNRNQA